MVLRAKARYEREALRWDDKAKKFREFRSLLEDIYKEAHGAVKAGKSNGTIEAIEVMAAEALDMLIEDDDAEVQRP
jgi:hypothetical protein